jgi:hypothetical protein
MAATILRAACAERPEGVEDVLDVVVHPPPWPIKPSGLRKPRSKLALYVHGDGGRAGAS